MKKSKYQPGMKRDTQQKTALAVLVLSFLLISNSYAQVDDETLGSIMTPDKVETSIGTLKFMDGAPLPETAQKVYDHLDTMRGVDAFLKGIPGASVFGIFQGAESLGVRKANQAMFMDKLLDSKPYFLTGNTSTMYVIPTLDLERDGPVVLEVPPGMLGMIDDAWFRFVADVGPFGPDKGKGGKFLLLPPGYKGEVPDGYFVVNSSSYRVISVLRVSIANGLDVAAKSVRENLRIYPLSKAANPPAMEFISASKKSFNTVHANDFNFYEEINNVIQKEPLSFLDPETRGLFASIGIAKGKPFKPNARMKKILVEAVAIGNATARSIMWYPRTDGTMKGIEVYPGANSAWSMGWVDKNIYYNGKDGTTMNSDARTFFHYFATGVTPAMAVTIPGKGSDYAIACVDSRKQPFDGSKTYRLHIPANPPVNNFWAVTLYDPQTRSEFQTDQEFPTVGSQTKGIKKGRDGSYDIYFAPKAPKGMENNWLQTIPGKSWSLVLRMYGPLKPWIDKTWRPSEVDPIK